MVMIALMVHSGVCLNGLTSQVISSALTFGNVSSDPATTEVSRHASMPWDLTPKPMFLNPYHALLSRDVLTERALAPQANKGTTMLCVSTIF
eukprot:3937572-Rhodomonas_salina.3